MLILLSQVVLVHHLNKFFYHILIHIWVNYTNFSTQRANEIQRASLLHSLLHEFTKTFIVKDVYLWARKRLDWMVVFKSHQTDSAFFVFHFPLELVFMAIVVERGILLCLKIYFPKEYLFQSPSEEFRNQKDELHEILVVVNWKEPSIDDHHKAWGKIVKKAIEFSNIS